MQTERYCSVSVLVNQPCCKRIVSYDVSGARFQSEWAPGDEEREEISFHLTDALSTTSHHHAMFNYNRGPGLHNRLTTEPVVLSGWNKLIYLSPSRRIPFLGTRRVEPVAFSSKSGRTAEAGWRSKESGLETMKHPLRFERPLSLRHLNQLTPFLSINIYFDARSVVCTSDPDFEMRGPQSSFSKANTKEMLKVTILYQNGNCFSRFLNGRAFISKITMCNFWTKSVRQ